MVLLASLAVSIAVAFIRGGRLTHLEEWPPRWGGLAAAALMLQVGVVLLNPQPLWVNQALIASSIVILLAFAFVNRRLPGFSLLAVGIVANAVAMAANGGRMPVSPDALVRAGLGSLAQLPQGTLLEGSKDILLRPEDANLWWLGDVIPIPPPVSVVLSGGDLVVAAGGAWYWQRALFPRLDAMR